MIPLVNYSTLSNLSLREITGGIINLALAFIICVYIKVIELIAVYRLLTTGKFASSNGGTFAMCKKSFMRQLICDEHHVFLYPGATKNQELSLYVKSQYRLRMTVYTSVDTNTFVVSVALKDNEFRSHFDRL